MEFIDAILESDRKAPRKQRHTSHRIRERIRSELPEHPVGESTVRRFVGRRKREMGWIHQETVVPQACGWGLKAQVDWYEAAAELDGERQPLQVFCMRSMGSAGAFHRAYPGATQQAFLEAHELGFAYFLAGYSDGSGTTTYPVPRRRFCGDTVVKRPRGQTGLLMSRDGQL